MEEPLYEAAIGADAEVSALLARDPAANVDLAPQPASRSC